MYLAPINANILDIGILETNRVRDIADRSFWSLLMPEIRKFYELLRRLPDINITIYYAYNEI